MQEYQTMILSILTDVAAAICLLGAVYMFIRGKNNRARRMLGILLLTWGLCSVGRSVCLQMGEVSLLLHPMRPVGLIGANIFIIIMMFFPIEVMLPGWLNLRRLVMLFVPVALLVLIYKVVLFLTGEEIEEFDTFSEFAASLPHFNVWFRLMFMLSVVFYNVSMLKMTYHYEKKYVRWKNDNYADVEYMDVSWMRFYAIGSIIIFLAWLPNVFMAEQWNFLIHSLVTVVLFSYYIYKGLFYESAYPEDYFKDANVNPLLSDIPACCSSDGDGGRDSQLAEPEAVPFEEKIPYYVDAFKQWMDKEKPYLYKDFKLTDVSRVLPLNRSYLSRVLNEGLGMNFCQVVRKYRVEESKKMLKGSPDLTIYQIAEECGFSSDTTFIRAFQQEMKKTPSQYRSSDAG